MIILADVNQIKQNPNPMKNAFFFLFLIFSCAQQAKEGTASVDPYGHIQDEQVKLILKRAIDKAGGYEAWSTVKSIKYTKHNMLFLEDSTVEVDNIQRHEYDMQPEFSARISWNKDGVNHLVNYSSRGAQKFENDSLTTKDPSQDVMSAMYVLGMPFKLLDAGTYLKYNGPVILPNGKDADEITATYSPEEHENHSTQDVWYYYFDVNDGSFYGAMVYHAPTYAYIDNMAFVENTPVKFHAHRKSYRSDSVRNIKFLRAEFWYSDYEVE